MTDVERLRDAFMRDALDEVRAMDLDEMKQLEVALVLTERCAPNFEEYLCATRGKVELNFIFVFLDCFPETNMLNILLLYKERFNYEKLFIDSIHRKRYKIAAFAKLGTMRPLMECSLIKHNPSDIRSFYTIEELMYFARLDESGKFLERLDTIENLDYKSICNDAQNVPHFRTFAIKKGLIAGEIEKDPFINEKLIAEDYEEGLFNDEKLLKERAFNDKIFANNLLLYAANKNDFKLIMAAMDYGAEVWNGAYIRYSRDNFFSCFLDYQRKKAI